MAAGRLYEFGDFRLDPTERLLFRSNKHVPLPPKAVDMLLLLVERRGHVVDKDTLLQEIWRETFVEEGSLAQNISILRRVLTEGRDGKELIETIPKRGYRFIASVKELAPQAAPRALPAESPIAPARWRARAPWVTGLAAAGFLGILLAFIFVVTASHPVMPFAPRDWILVTDFENSTGDPRFDKSLLTALTIQLRQSEHFNVFPRELVVETLKRMQKPVDASVDEPLGREIAQREGIRAVLACSIARVGPTLILTADLVDPKTGLAVRSYSERAPDESGVLAALDSLADQVRRGLGESLYQVTRTSRRLPQVTTSSLAALNYYAEGTFKWERGEYQNAMRLLNQAVAEDPGFAMAHRALGMNYYSHIYSDSRKSQEHFEKALQLSDRLTDRELRLIRAYYKLAQLNFGEGESLFQQYLALYPDDLTAQSSLAHAYMDEGRSEQAIRGYAEVLRIDPHSASANINIATSYANLGKASAALPFYARAFELEPSWVTNDNLNNEYGLTLAMAGQLDKAGEVFALALEVPGMRPKALRSLALLQEYQGRYAEARKKLEQAIHLTEDPEHLLPNGRNHLLLSYVLDAQSDTRGELRELDTATKKLLTHDSVSARGFLFFAGTSYARLGQLHRASQILQELAKKADPQNHVAVDDAKRLEAEIELARGHVSKAIELFGLCDDYPTFGRTLDGLARAYVRAGRPEQAIATYEKLLARPFGYWLGTELQQSWLLAHVRLARLYADGKNTAKAREQLDRLAQLWSSPDAGLAIYEEALKIRKEL